MTELSPLEARPDARLDISQRDTSQTIRERPDVDRLHSLLASSVGIGTDCGLARTCAGWRR
jgi:hypothetical protein